jgi:hypothetical protein
VGIRYADHATPLSAKVGTISPRSGGRSVGIVRLRTEATDFFLIVVVVVAAAAAAAH